MHNACTRMYIYYPLPSTTIPSPLKKTPVVKHSNYFAKNAELDCTVGNQYVLYVNMHISMCVKESIESIGHVHH